MNMDIQNILEDAFASAAKEKAREVSYKELRSALKDLLEQVESLDGYQVTRDLDRYKAEACFDDAIERARNALSRS
jgi:hypothetical protein